MNPDFNEAKCRATCDLCWGDAGQRWPCARAAGIRARLAAASPVVPPIGWKPPKPVIFKYDDKNKPESYAAYTVGQLHEAYAAGLAASPSPRTPEQPEQPSVNPVDAPAELSDAATDGRAAGALAKRRVFIDMDGVIVDFEGHMRATGTTGDELKAMVGAYAAMPARDGALAAVRSIIGMGFEVWIATKPPTGIAHAYAGKAEWVLEHLPELKRRIIITHNKGLLGGARDFLIDDRPHKADCESFAGTLVRFGPAFNVDWPEALDVLRSSRPSGSGPAEHSTKSTGTPGAIDAAIAMEKQA